MNGNQKRILYTAVSFLLWLAMAAGEVLLLIFTVPRPFSTSAWLALIGFLLLIALRIPAAVHELGHLLFGWLAGMKFAGTTVSYLRIANGKVRLCNPDYDGATEMFPKNGKKIRLKTTLFALGGSLFCFLVGGGLLTCYLLLPYSVGLLFGAMTAISILYEGLHALYPAELPAGKTDGAVLYGILKHSPEEEIMLRVLTAQGILYRGGYGEIDRKLLFSAPVVREDLPAYHALLFLQCNYLRETGEKEAAESVLARLKSLEAYLTDEEREELEKIVK